MNTKKVNNIDLKQYGMFLALIAIFILFFILSKGANATPVEEVVSNYALRP